MSKRKCLKMHWMGFAFAILAFCSCSLMAGCTLPRFTSGAGEVKVVKSLSADEAAKSREYIEKGGVLIVAPIASQQDLDFTKALVEKKSEIKFKAQKGPAHAYDTRISAGNCPVFDWPYAYSDTLPVGDNRLDGGRPEFEDVQSGYTKALRLGKGMLIVSVLPLEVSDWMRGNLAKHRELEAHGIRFVSLTHEYSEFDDWRGKRAEPTVAGGMTTLAIKNVNETTTNLNLAVRMTIKAKDGASRTYLVRRQSTRLGEDFKIQLKVDEIDLNGPCEARFELEDWDSGWKFTLAEMKVTLPDWLEVVPPHFRGGVVSTCRKRAEIRAGLRVNRRFPGLDGQPWKLSALDAKGKTVASAEGVFAGEQRDASAWLPFPKDAPAGTYELVASVAGATAKGKLRIVAPEKGQIIVDQDGFLLDEGKPYFPLGVYHCHTFNLEEPIDDTGLKACDMGFNWMQLWEWDYRTHLSLNREQVAKYSEGDLKKLATEEEKKAFLDKRMEENRHFRELLKAKGMYICLEGFKVWENCIVERPGPGAKYSFEKHPTMAQDVRAMGTDPDHLVRMYYVADEAGGNFHQALSRAAKIYHDNDPGFHPVFNLGNEPAVLAGDFGGLDRYCRYYGGVNSVLDMIGAIDAQRRALEPYGMRPFSVPQAFGNSPKQPTETPEYVRVQAYLSLIHGASGLGFYCWKQTGDWKGGNRQGMGWNPPTAHEVKKLIAEIRVFDQALMTADTRRLVSEDGNVHALICGDAATGRYLVAANALEQPMKTVLKTNLPSNAKLEPLFNAPAADAAKVKLALPGWGTAVWRLSR